MNPKAEVVSVSVTIAQPPVAQMDKYAKAKEYTITKSAISQLCVQ